MENRNAAPWTAEPETASGKQGLNWGLISTYRQEIMGFACLWIIAHHNFFNWPDSFAVLSRIFAYGNVGVDMFLFLSGISLYFAFQRKPRLGDFYKRRVVRLMVPYAFIAVPFWVWKDLLLHDGNFLLDVSMISSYFIGSHMTWYVGVSLVFYLAFPLIYQLMHETRSVFGVKLQENTIAILLPTFMAGLCLVIQFLLPEFYSDIEIGLTRSVIFLIGCGAGRCVFEKRTLRSETLWASVIFLIFYTLAFRPMVGIRDFWIRISYAPMSIAVVLLLAALFHRFSLASIKQLLRYFGARSLEIYLLHVLLRYVCIRCSLTTVLDPWGILSYAIVIAVSLVLSEIIHRLGGRISKLLLGSKTTPSVS